MTTKPKITRTDAKNNPWYQFLLETIKLDSGLYRQGEHWFMAIFYLHQLNKFPNFELEEVGKIFSDGHLVKKSFKANLPHALALILQELEQQLGNPKKIEEIDFSGLYFDEKADFSNFIFPVDVSFEKAEFAGEYHFNNAVFCGNTSFDKAVFHNDARFDRTVFFRSVGFTGANFSKGIVLNDALFCQSAHFNDATISNDAHFNRATFSNINNFFSTVNFTNTTFCGNVNFDDAKFFGHITFSKVKFYGSANFIKSELCGDIDFIGAEFKSNGVFFNTTFSIHERLSKDLKFTNAVFSSGATFVNATFAGPVFFEKVKFKEFTRFSKASFSEKVDFSEVHFFEKLDFSDVDFRNGALFYKAKFSGDTDFNDATFKKTAFFTEATFYKSAIFYRAILENINFSNTRFEIRAPHLYDAKISADIVWERDTEYWPHVRNRIKDETDDDYKKRTIDNQNAYENLSSRMKILDKYHDEHFFYRQEMRCRRVFEKFFIRFPYMVYDAFSDYGYSIGKAFLAWLAHIVAGIFFLMIIIRMNIDWGHKNLELAEGFWCSISTSFSNAHRFLSFHNGALDYCHKYLENLYLFDVIWAIQSILGIPFLFMLLLTLRIRFRLK